MRIDKLLAHAGFGTRKEVKKLLKDQLVLVNGTIITDPKTHVDETTDRIVVDGEDLHYQQLVYYMLNKPAGYLCAAYDRHDPVVNELIDDVHELFSIGRLDKDSEGLLIMTNDGKLAHLLTSPKHHCPKIYEVTVDQPLTSADQEAFRTGIMLDDGMTLPADLEIIPFSDQLKAYVTLYEGRFHQIKRMMSACGKQVTSLIRLQMGPLKLDETLETGQYRVLTREEVESLYHFDTAA